MKKTYNVEVDCANCAAKMERKIQQLPEVKMATITYATKQLAIVADNPEKLKYLILLDAAGVYEPSARKKLVERVAKIGKPLKKVPIIDKAFHKITGSTDYSRAPENMKQTLANMLESDKDLDFSKVITKTFILWGKKDTTTPPRQATIMYEKLPNAELKFYANWTHAPYISSPEELARALTALIKRIQK